MSRDYRQKYPKTYKKWKKKYYAKHNYRVAEKGRRYTSDEDILILEHEMSDVEIAKQLKRSVASIQCRRCKLIRKQEYIEQFMKG